MYADPARLPSPPGSRWVERKSRTRLTNRSLFTAAQSIESRPSRRWWDLAPRPASPCGTRPFQHWTPRRALERLARTGGSPRSGL